MNDLVIYDGSTPVEVIKNSTNKARSILKIFNALFSDFNASELADKEYVLDKIHDVADQMDMYEFSSRELKDIVEHISFVGNDLDFIEQKLLGNIAYSDAMKNDHDYWAQMSNGRDRQRFKMVSGNLIMFKKFSI